MVVDSNDFGLDGPSHEDLCNSEVRIKGYGFNAPWCVSCHGMFLAHRFHPLQFRNKLRLLES